MADALLPAAALDDEVRFVCPSCHRAARIAAEAATLVNLSAAGCVDLHEPHQAGDVPVLAEGGAAICRDCGYVATLAEFALAQGWLDGWLAALAAADAAAAVESPR
jgi:hypothetical protein